MTKEIRLNAFDMNCVGHIQHGMWGSSARSLDRVQHDPILAGLGAAGGTRQVRRDLPVDALEPQPSQAVRTGAAQMRGPTIGDPAVGIRSRQLEPRRKITNPRTNHAAAL